MAHNETTTTKTESKPEKHEEVRTVKHRIGSDHPSFGDSWSARIIAVTFAAVVLWMLALATFGSGEETTTTAKHQTTTTQQQQQQQQPTEPWYKRMWITPDHSLSPFDKSGGKKSAGVQSPFIGNAHAGAAPDPFTTGNKSGPYTNAACKGGKRTATLVPGAQPHLVDRYNACRIPSYVPSDVLIDAQDERGQWYRLQPGSTREVVAVRAVNTTVDFSYTRCSKESPSGVLNWDCTLLTQYASQ